MKNKFICALLTTVMVLSFAACGSQGNGAAASTESTVASESQVTESNTEASSETVSTESTSKEPMKTTLLFPQRMLPLLLKRSRMP